MSRSAKLFGYLTSGLVLFAMGATLRADTKTSLVPAHQEILSEITNLIPIGSTNPSTVLHLAIGLQPRDQKGFEAFADSVSNPKSLNYRQFITPAEVGQRFGATRAQVDAIVSYLTQNGIKVTEVASNHLAIMADCTVAQAQAAFQASIKNYRDQNPLGVGQIVFYANSAVPKLPASIVNSIVSIDGLETWTRPMPKSVLVPSTTRTCYNLAPAYTGGFTGSGRTVAVSNFDGYRLTNVPLYYSHFSLPTPPGGVGTNIHEVHVGGGSSTGSPAGEGDLDIQMELGMAPLATQYIYDGVGTGSGYISTLTKIVTDNLADACSESYGWNISGSTITSAHNQHLSMTTQGITYMAASGDSGTSIGSFDYPDYEPEVLQVGGTVAVVNGGGVRTSEVGWPDSGGGWATRSVSFNVRPSWQVGTGVPSVASTANKRLVPDVGLHSAGTTNNSQGAYQFYFNGGLNSGSVGTSFASPVWCGSLMDAEQKIISLGGLPPNGAGKQRFGRMQDLIYSQNGNSSAWFDITSGNNGNLPNGNPSNAGAGWDSVTGWGAINWDGFITLYTGGGSAAPTTLTENNISGQIGQTVTQSATLVKTSDTSPVVGVSVTFTVNGGAAGSGTTSGTGLAQANFTIPESLGVGSKPIACAWAGNGTYGASNGAGTLTVTKANTALAVPAKSGQYGTIVALTATLTRTTDNGTLTSKSVTFKVDGNSVGSANTNGSGIATVNYTIDSSLSAGSHTISADFAGDSNYNAAPTGNGTLTAQQTSSAIGSVASPSGTYGQTVVLQGTLTRTTDNAALGGKSVDFAVGGGSVGNSNTNGSGVASFNYLIPESRPVGANTITLTFAGDSQYIASAANGTLTINKGNTTMVAQDSSGDQGTNVTISATLTRNQDSAGVNGRSVSFSIDSNPIGVAISNPAGVASLVFAIPGAMSLGAHQITADFAGDSQYNSSSDNTHTLTVTSSAPADVSGNVDLEFITDPTGQTATIEFRTPTTLSVVYSGPITLDGSGNYTISGVPPGTYDVAVKFTGWLRQVLPSVTLSGGSNPGIDFSLLGGDSFDDNSVDLFDLNQEFTSFGATGAPGFDPADLNWDGSVDTFDINIVLVNFNVVGDN